VTRTPLSRSKVKVTGDIMWRPPAQLVIIIININIIIIGIGIHILNIATRESES